MQPIFITGIGTGIGKTVVAAMVTEALHADYWKPVQAGFSEGTDKEEIKALVSNPHTVIHDEVYKLKMPASPHIAAKKENIKIDLEEIYSHYKQLPAINNQFVVEGAGGILVPLNDDEFVIDLIKKLNAKVILVSKNYLGSINHSLLTAKICKAENINVIGWIFNCDYLSYEDEIVGWSGFQKIASISQAKKIDKDFVSIEAKKMREKLISIL